MARRIRPGTWKGSRVARHTVKRPATMREIRSSRVEFFDRRRYKVGKNYYGPDPQGEYSRVPVKAHRRKGVYVRRTMRRRTRRRK